jgi:malonyl-CoA O-methyltransferase
MLGTDLLTRMWRTGKRPTSLPVAEAYAKWAPMYPPRAHNPVMEAEESIVRPLVTAIGAARALDVGSGTGRNLAILRAAATRTIVGIDLSAPMLLRGAEPFCRVRGDALALPFRSRSFDLVTSSLMCGDLASLAPFLQEASRVLAEDGHLIYSDFHPGWAQAKWRRTFVGADGRTYELPLHHNEIDEHLRLLETCGLQVRAIREPGVCQHRTPVVVVFHAVKHRDDFR